MSLILETFGGWRICIVLVSMMFQVFGRWHMCIATEDIASRVRMCIGLLIMALEAMQSWRMMLEALSTGTCFFVLMKYMHYNFYQKAGNAL